VYYRYFIPSDFEALYAIEEECFQPPHRFPREYMQLLLDSPDTSVWIAEDGAKMAGFGIVEWYMGDEKGEKIERGRREVKEARKVAYVHTLEVLPSERGRGVGRELLIRLEEAAEEADAEAILLHVSEENAGAIGLYTARGFRYQRREADYYSPGMAGVVYRKGLGVDAPMEGIHNEPPV